MLPPEDEAEVWIRQALHDLSQPLTALECGLYLGTMSPDGVRAPTREELLATILEALVLCERTIHQVRGIQNRMNARDEKRGTVWIDS